MMTKLTFEDIDPEVCKANGWDTLNIYSNGNLVGRTSLSEVDSSGMLEVLLENDLRENLTVRYSITNPLAGLPSDFREVQSEEIKPETLSGSLDDIRKSLTENRKSSKTLTP